MNKKTKKGRPNKLGKTKLIAVRLPLELIKKLKANGEISQQIRAALEASLKVLLICLFVSCGNEKRCYTKTEAIMACQVDEMSRSGVDAPTALMLCQPHYPYEGCYEI